MTPWDSPRFLETLAVSHPVYGHRRPDPLHIDWETQHFPQTSILWSNLVHGMQNLSVLSCLRKVGALTHLRWIFGRRRGVVVIGAQTSGLIFARFGIIINSQARVFRWLQPGNRRLVVGTLHDKLACFCVSNQISKIIMLQGFKPQSEPCGSLIVPLLECKTGRRRRDGTSRTQAGPWPGQGTPIRAVRLPNPRWNQDTLQSNCSEVRLALMDLLRAAGSAAAGIWPRGWAARKECDDTQIFQPTCEFLRTKV